MFKLVQNSLVMLLINEIKSSNESKTSIAQKQKTNERDEEEEKKVPNL